MRFLLDALWRMTMQTHHHIKWFCYDRPNRIKNGYGPDGLYPHERSHADQERLPPNHPEYRELDKLNTCAAEPRRRYGL